MGASRQGNDSLAVAHRGEWVAITYAAETHVALFCAATAEVILCPKDAWTSLTQALDAGGSAASLEAADGDQLRDLLDTLGVALT